MIFCLVTLTFHRRDPISSLIPYIIKFTQRGFIENAAFDGRILHVGRGISVRLKPSQ
jgi:hypothetical protein